MEKQTIKYSKTSAEAKDDGDLIPKLGFFFLHCGRDVTEFGAFIRDRTPIRSSN